MKSIRLLVIVLFLLISPAVVRAQISALVHQDTTKGNFFGSSVSVDGNRAVIGASAEDVCGPNSGAAYIYEYTEGEENWREVAKLIPDDCEKGMFFGRSVSLSGDRALISGVRSFFGSSRSNAAYVFERDPATGKWNQSGKIIGDPDVEEGAFATSVSLDGDRALIVTSGDPSGMKYGGAAHIFERNPHTNQWEHKARLVGSKGLAAGIFGGIGALDGDRVAVASSTYFKYKPGSVYIFERDPNSGTWREVQQITKIDDFFIPLDLDQDRLIVGESRAGHRKSGQAGIFTRGASGTWYRTATLFPGVPYEFGAFGSAVSISGDRALVAGYDEQLGFDFNVDRVVYAFRYDDNLGEWVQQRVLDVGEVAFGSAIDHKGQVAVLGQASEQKPGAAYIVHLP